MGACIIAQVHFIASTEPERSFDTEANIEVWDFGEDVAFYGTKDYPFISAISGIRGPADFRPLIPLRGMPFNWTNDKWPSHRIGWLFWSEIEAALKHRGVAMDELQPDTRRVLRAVKALVDELGDHHVRFVFWILD